MKKWNLTTAALLTLVCANICFADTLVITYRSGKTQTVSLDEPSTTINSWQFVGGTAAATPQQQPVVQQPAPHQEAPKAAAETVKETKKPDSKISDKKSNTRFMWNAKPIAD